MGAAGQLVRPKANCPMGRIDAEKWQNCDSMSQFCQLFGGTEGARQSGAQRPTPVGNGGAGARWGRARCSAADSNGAPAAKTRVENLGRGQAHGATLVALVRSPMRAQNGRLPARLMRFRRRRSLAGKALRACSTAWLSHQTMSPTDQAWL